jgi:HD domain
MHTDPTSKDAAIDLLRALGAPSRLQQHGEIVAEVAFQLSDALSSAGIEHDGQMVLVGAALHDAGKIIHPEELDLPGHEHEAAGERLLLDHGISPRLARVCRTHGAWDDAELSLEELLISLADHLWKGTREPRPEAAIIATASAQVGIEEWEMLLKLDTEFERIAARGTARLAEALGNDPFR